MQSHTSKYEINVPSDDEILNDVAPNVRSDVHILPLSLEDNSTVLGTMSILDNLADLFDLPQETKAAEYLPFDTVKGTFDAVAARTHFELLLSQRNHVKYMKGTEIQMRSNDKGLEGLTEEEVEHTDKSGEDEDGEVLGTSSLQTVTLQHERQRFESEDKPGSFFGLGL